MKTSKHTLSEIGNFGDIGTEIQWVKLMGNRDQLATVKLMGNTFVKKLVCCPLVSPTVKFFVQE